MKAALSVLPQHNISLRVLHIATGPVTQSDIDLAAAALQNGETMVLAFNIPFSSEAEAAAKRYGVEVQQFKVIYDLVDHVRAAMVRAPRD